MVTTLNEHPEGADMDALRALRADVPGPSDEQREAAWQRVQVARAATPEKGNNSWLIGGIAAVSAGIVAVGAGVVMFGGTDEKTSPAGTTSSVTTSPVKRNPAPYATGPVWKPTADERAVMKTYRSDHIHYLPDGRLRLDIANMGKWFETATKALNQEGIPVRFWVVQGDFEQGWQPARQVMVIDGSKGIDQSAKPLPQIYQRAEITPVVEDTSDGKQVTALIFPEVPTKPVDIMIQEGMFGSPPAGQ